MVFVNVCCCCEYFQFFLLCSGYGRGIHAYNLATTAGAQRVWGPARDNVNRSTAAIIFISVCNQLHGGVAIFTRCRNFARDTFSIAISRFCKFLCCVKWIHNIHIKKNLLLFKAKRKKKSRASAYSESGSYAEESIAIVNDLTMIKEIAFGLKFRSNLQTEQLEKYVENFDTAKEFFIFLIFSTRDRDGTWDCRITKPCYQQTQQKA